MDDLKTFLILKQDLKQEAKSDLELFILRPLLPAGWTSSHTSSHLLVRSAA